MRVDCSGCGKQHNDEATAALCRGAKVRQLMSSASSLAQHNENFTEAVARWRERVGWSGRIPAAQGIDAIRAAYRGMRTA